MDCYIEKFEQNREDRAAYGEQLLKKLEQRLNVKELSERRFREFRRVPKDKIFNRIPYTHLKYIVKIDTPVKRAFYEMETIRECWSYKELER